MNIKYLKMTGIVLILLCIFLFPQLFSSFVFGFLIGIGMALQEIEITPEKVEQQLAGFTIYILAFSSFISLLLYWLYFKIKNAVTGWKESLFGYCKFGNFPGLQVVLSLITGASFYFILSGIMYFTNLPERFPGHQELLAPLFEPHIIVTIMVMGIIVVLVEEIAFRGLIFNRMRKDLPVAMALIFQAVLFGLVHFNILQGGYAFLLGLICALAYFWSDSFWAPFAVHFSFNISSVVTTQVDQLEHIVSNNMAVFMIAGGMVLVVALVYLYIQHRHHINAGLVEAA